MSKKSIKRSAKSLATDMFAAAATAAAEVAFARARRKTGGKAKPAGKTKATKKKPARAAAKRKSAAKRKKR
ncbi:hypothetical protein [Actinospica sp.]|jgi:hypothetical protein|uniref:hypothetical protein n=1 Tax=Actinospica sp. TaxID=1872142 RepID=UPI002BB90707|nr:hypothetical protein [Actinospica sp.]HEX3859229.1 hypothetical protein [Pseudolabrys sp.]HWG28864.1 hypothetical protein [Actinospica sp.]